MRLLMSLGIFYPSQVGGPGNTLYWIGKELIKKGCNVTVLVSDIGVTKEFAARGKWIDLNGIKIKYSHLKYPNSSLKIALLTIKEIPQNDVVMLSSIFYKPNFLVGLVSLFYRKRIIWSPRGELFVRHGKFKAIYLQVVKTVFGNRVIFHATSPEEVGSVHRIFGANTKCVMIPNYMELPIKVYPKTNEKYLLYVGRIMPIKALEKLIEGVALSVEFMEQDYKLILAGDNKGDYYKTLQSLVLEKELTDRVIFKGMVEGEDKEYLYAGAKATMLVSHSENFGNVIIESLAQGTPAITSQGTPWQILEQTGAGYWIDNSSVIIGKVIDRLLTLSEAEYSTMRERAYRLCLDNFDIKSNINKWLEIINCDVQR